MRLSDAGLRRRQTKLLYLDHRPPPWLTEDATRDRSNRLLDSSADGDRCATLKRSRLRRYLALTRQLKRSTKVSRICTAMTTVDLASDTSPEASPRLTLTGS
jgi:hypothetical protein